MQDSRRAARQYVFVREGRQEEPTNKLSAPPREQPEVLLGQAQIRFSQAATARGYRSEPRACNLQIRL
jgi:hypothetical protein